MHVYYLQQWLDEQNLNLPRLYLVLKKLFGESSHSYDSYKSSFGYDFSLKLFKADQEFSYALSFSDPMALTVLRLHSSPKN
ncbi:MAG: hypothetical protein R2880_01280 [Deinococcales bacterium]